MIESLMLNPTLGYSQAVRAGNLLFVSGQVAVDERGETVGIGDPKTQAERVFENLRATLAAAGADLASVAMMRTYATSLGFLRQIREDRRQAFGPTGHFPASTFVVITSLAKPEYLVEIEAVAVIGGTAAPQRAARKKMPATRAAARTSRRRPSIPRRRTARPR